MGVLIRGGGELMRRDSGDGAAANPNANPNPNPNPNPSPNRSPNPNPNPNQVALTMPVTYVAHKHFKRVYEPRLAVLPLLKSASKDAGATRATLQGSALQELFASKFVQPELLEAARSAWPYPKP